MSIQQSGTTRPARANLMALPNELLDRIVYHVVGSYVSRNYRLLLPLLQTCQRLHFPAQQRLFAWVHVRSLSGLHQFSETVAPATALVTHKSVKDMEVDIRDCTHPFRSPCDLGPPPSFLHLLENLQSLTLSSYSHTCQHRIYQHMLEELPIQPDSFPQLEQFWLTCSETIDVSALLPFWAAPQLKSMHLRGIVLRSDDQSDRHEKFLAAVRRCPAGMKPMEILYFTHVAFELDEPVLAALGGLRAVESLQMNLMVFGTKVQRRGWSGLIAALAPHVKHLSYADEKLGISSAGDTAIGGMSVFTADEIPPLGLLSCVEKLEIVEQQLAFALGLRPDSSTAPRDFMPSSVERLHVEVSPDRMDRLDFYAALKRLMAACHAGQLPKLKAISFYFQYCYNDFLEAGTELTYPYSYSDTKISLYEIEDRGLSETDGFEFPGGRTLEHKAFEQACEMFGIRVTITTNF